MNADRVIDSLVREFGKLLPTIADSGTDGSAAQAIAHALVLLRAREVGGQGFLTSQFENLSSTVSAVADLLDGQATDGVAKIRAVISASTPSTSVAHRETVWRDALRALQALIVQANQLALSPTTRASLAALVVDWESRDLVAQMPAGENGSSASSEDITSETLAAYLRDRFAEPDLVVTHMQPLAGGFGKQTIIFAAEGRELSGEYVMRRDIGEGLCLGANCHWVAEEYPVIRATFERGFPAPDALWLDTQHRLLPGGNFIIMRRSPGQLGGNVFGAQGAIPVDLADVLAEKMAVLHGLAPLRELGDLTYSIRSDLWDMPIDACVRRYISNYYASYLAEDHTPSPSIAALYGWLLNNAPSRTGTPSLLHGDIGFHNLLFHEGRVSVLVDWEFAHLGDPAEDLGYVKTTIGQSLDWPRFMTRYQAAGGRNVDAATLHYFQVWAFVRNATAANIAAGRLDTGRASDLKLAVLPYQHIPNFIRGAQALIAAGP